MLGHNAKVCACQLASLGFGALIPIPGFLRRVITGVAIRQVSRQRSARAMLSD